MAWRRPGNKPLSEPMLFIVLGLNELRVQILSHNSQDYFPIYSSVPSVGLFAVDRFAMIKK